MSEVIEAFIWVSLTLALLTVTGFGWLLSHILKWMSPDEPDDS